MATSDWRTRLHQELRRHRPAAVVVTIDESGEEKSFKPSGRDRGMWTRLIEALPASWLRIELRDKEDSTLWGIDSPTAAGSSTAGPVQFGKGTVVDHVGGLMKLMLQAQDVALARQGETLSKLQASYETLVTTLTSRLTSLENLVSSVLQTAYDATLVSAEAHAQLMGGGGGGGGDNMKMFAKLMGMKMGPAAKPNGHARPQASTPTTPPSEG